jgi:hypothetical protein
MTHLSSRGHDMQKCDVNLGNVPGSVGRFPRFEAHGCVPILAASALSITVISTASMPIYSGILSAVTFAAAPFMVPEWRIDYATILCPGNWAIFGFGLQLLVMPAIVTLFGPEAGSLPVLPSHNAIEGAVLMSTLAFVSFLVGYGSVARRPLRYGRIGSLRPHIGLVLPFILIGIIGFLAAFGTDFSTLFVAVERQPIMSQPRGLFGSFLRPFLAFSLIILWARRLERSRAERNRRGTFLTTALFAAAVIIPLATYGLARNIFIVPLLSMVAAHGRHIRRVSMLALASGILILGAVSVATESYRLVSRYDDVNLGDSSSQSKLMTSTHISQDLQVYGDAPQFLGFVIEKSDWGRHLSWGSTLLGSMLGPIPQLGRSLRNHSGTAMYNSWIYGNSLVQDQIIPFQGELFINFHLPGLIVGYLLLGIMVGILHQMFTSSTTVISAFIIQFIAIWMCFLIQGGMTSVAYIAVTFIWPLPVYIVFDKLQRSGSREGHAKNLLRLAGEVPTPLEKLRAKAQYQPPVCPSRLPRPATQKVMNRF